MKLIPYLVNIKEKNKISTIVLPNEFKEKLNSRGYIVKEISNVDYLNEESFKEGTHLGSNLWTIYTHYSVDSKFYQLAFKIKCENDEIIEDFVLRFKSYSDNKEEKYILRYIQNEDIFIDSTQYLLKRKIETKNIFDTAGFILLEVENIKKNTKEEIPIRVLPSSISYDDYIEMINDLISIREDIVISDGSKVGVGNHWNLRRDNYNDCINSIYNHMTQIDKNPKVNLSMEDVKMPYNKIKNIKPKTIIEKNIYPYKEKYTTKVGKDDFNIYENQIIKYSLIQIKDKIERYKYEFNKSSDYNRLYLEETKKNIEDLFDDNIEYRKSNLKEKVSKSKEKIDDILLQSVENQKLNAKKYCGHIGLEFSIEVNIRQQDELYKPNIILEYDETTKFFILKLKTNTWNYDSKFFDYDLRYGDYTYFDLNYVQKYDNYTYFNTISKYKLTGKYGNRKVDLKLTSRDLKKIKFLYDFLTDKSSVMLNLQVIALKKNSLYNNPLLEEDYNSYSQYEEFTIDCEDLITINGQKPYNYPKEELEKFIEFNLSDLNSENEQEKLGFLESLEYKMNFVEKQRTDFYGINSLDDTLVKIDKLLNLNFLKNIRCKRDMLKPTQIFINDFSYNKVFRELKKLNKKIRFLDNISPNMLFLKTTSNIYEYWCLFKIVDVLINDLGWKLNNKEEVLNDIDKFLKCSDKSEKPCVKIMLEHEVINSDVLHNQIINTGMLYLDLIYEGKIYYEENKFKTPDFQFILKSDRLYDSYDIEKRVYLDAKYRNYKEQGSNTFWRDINQVSIDKYYTTFINTANKSDVSFIVHSDKHNKYNCFGGNHVVKDGNLKEINNKNEIYYENDIDNHKFGSFYLLPSYSFNINKFIRMVLEYHLGIYTMCWSCGEIHDIKIEHKKTKGGNPKYHFKCNNCGEFWVKNHCAENKHTLIKHTDNYHSINKCKRDPWYVICPVCFEGMKQESVYNEDNNIFMYKAEIPF